jgi:hypothetical protein
MTDDSRLLTTIRISEDDIYSENFEDPYDNYLSARRDFGNAQRALNKAIKTLHKELDEPLRSAGLVPEGKDWTLKEDPQRDGLMIYVWSEPKRRGRKRRDPPMNELTFATKNPRAA